MGNQLLAKTDGKKTYLAALGLAAYGLLGWYLGLTGGEKAIELLLEAFAVFGARVAISKVTAA